MFGKRRRMERHRQQTLADLAEFQDWLERLTRRAARPAEAWCVQRNDEHAPNHEEPLRDLERCCGCGQTIVFEGRQGYGMWVTLGSHVISEEDEL